MNIIIDATTQGSGGGRRHLKEILKYISRPNEFSISKIYIWGPRSILSIIPDNNIIEKKTAKLLNYGILGVLIWQIFFRDRCFKSCSFDCIFSPFGNYFGALRPYITMSRNMLMFEKNEMKKYGFSFSRIKLWLLFFIQKKSFVNSDGLIFLSKYARNIIMNQINFDLKKTKIINHGISEEFRLKPRIQKEIENYSIRNPFKLLYVSNILPYKYHENVILSFEKIIKMGLPVTLTLVGKVDVSTIGNNLEKIIKRINKDHIFIEWFKDVSIDQVKKFYHHSDGFVFASSCENMPNILLEAMSSGLPIACSNRGPMKEFLDDAGIYFDPTEVGDTFKAMTDLIVNFKKRSEISKKSYKLSLGFSWKKCSHETIYFINNTVNK